MSTTFREAGLSRADLRNGHEAMMMAKFLADQTVNHRLMLKHQDGTLGTYDANADALTQKLAEDMGVSVGNTTTVHYHGQPPAVSPPPVPPPVVQPATVQDSWIVAAAKKWAVPLALAAGVGGTIGYQKWNADAPEKPASIAEEKQPAVAFDPTKWRLELVDESGKPINSAESPQ